MTERPHDRPRLEPLDRDECLRLLASQAVGRIGITVSALPVVLPVNFALADDAIVLRTIPGTKLDAATKRAVVAFEVDSYEPDGRSGWSVLVIGTAARVPDSQVESVESLDIDAWPLDGHASNFVRIDLAHVTGRRFRRSP